MSIFLSCILIKLSLFCLLRVQHVLLSEISFNICIFFSFICSIDIVFRFINLRDLKAIVAYGSVLHTNLLIALIHLDSFKVLKSSVFYIWGHSLSTTSLFIIINVLESRYSSRNILYISGVWYSSPVLGYLIFFNLLSFLDLPISLFFWGELWLWVISIEQLFLLSIQVLFLVNVVFTSIFFKVWWCILFGTPDISIKKINSNDLNYEVNLILIWLAFIQFILGVQPGILSYISGLYL
jgi:NADH:ubiquinone oxidoreductase subunit 4 (subunit M)